MSNNTNEFVLDLLALLDKQKSKTQINTDIKNLEQIVRKLKLTATLAKGTTKSEINQTIKQLESQLRQVKIQAKMDNRQLNREINAALRNVSARDIQLNINSNSERLNAQVRRAVSQAREFVSRNPISVNIDLKKEKLMNQLATFTNKHTKINESSYWLGEAERLRGVIGSITNRDELRNATDQFQVFTTGVRATGYAAVSTTDRIKGMLGNVAKISNTFGLAFVAVNKFRQSLSNLKDMDTLLVEISKTSEMTVSQLEELGKKSYSIASKYGVLAKNFMTSVQEMSRAGFGEDKAQPLAELATLAQSAGDLTADLANEYLIASNAAYGYSGNVEQLNALLDAQNQVTNRNAVSMTELADATKVAANQLANSNISENEMTALLGTGIATTKESGQVVGRAVKAIVMNLQQVQNTEEGLETTAEDLGKVESRLDSLGIKMKETADGITRLRNPVAILSELAEVYNSLPKDSAERANIIADIGGKYRGNVLSSILSNWETYIKMLGDYEDAAGSALREAEKSADSWEGRLAQLSNSWDHFVSSVTSKDAIKGGISFLDNMIQSFTKLTDIIGAVPMLLATVNGSLTALNKNYGLTQLVNWQTRRIDVRGNIMGFDISAYRDQVQHFRDASVAMEDWNNRLIDGTANINDFGNATVQNNEQLRSYLQTTSVDAPASLRGYRSYLNATGQSTDALRLRTVLLNTALSMFAGLAVQAVITGITKAIDKFNVTVTEAQESVDGVNSRIEELKSQIEELNNLEYKSDFDKQKIQQLEKELELQKRILEVEQKRLYQNQIGTSFSDYFDEESLVTKQMSEDNRYNKESYTYLSMRFEIDKSSLNETNTELASLQKRLENETLAGHERFAIEGKVTKLTEKRDKILKEQQTIEEQLTLNMGEYLTNYQMAKEAVDSGLLDGDDLTKAEEMADYWNQIYQDSSLMVMNIQKANGTYDNTNDLLLRRFGNIAVDDLLSLSDDDKRIALSFAPDNKIGFEELQQKIEETKNGVEELNDTEVSPTLSISDTIDQLNTQLKPISDALKSAYQDIFTDDGFTLENVDIAMLDSIKSKLDELNKLEGANINIDYSSFENLARVLTDTSSSADDVQAAFNLFATSVLNGTDIMENMDESTMQLVTSMLESMGVANAEEVVMHELALAKEEARIATLDLANMSDEAMISLFGEAQSAGITQAEIYKLAAAEIAYNSAGLSVEDKITKLGALAGAYGDTATAALAAAAADRVANGHGDFETIMSDMMAQIGRATSSYQVDFSNVGGGKKSASKAGKEAADKYLEAFEKELKALDDLKDRGKITEKQYLDALRRLYLKYFRDKEKYLKEYEKYENQYLDGMKSLYESAFSYITKQIDKRIDAIGAEKDAAVSALEAERDARLEEIEAEKKRYEEQIEFKEKEIEAREKEIKAMQDANEERKRSLDLQKAEYDLQRMQNQRTDFVYKDGQMSYLADTSGIRDAKQEVEDAKLEIDISKIQTEIDLLEEEKDSLQELIDALDKEAEKVNDYYDKLIAKEEQRYDAMIKGMEDYKSQFEELTELFENAQMEAALSELGINMDALLSGSQEEFEKLKAAYTGILADMSRGNDEIIGQLSRLAGINAESVSYLESTKGAFENLGAVTLEGLGNSVDGVADSTSALTASAGDASAAMGGVQGSIDGASKSIAPLNEELEKLNKLITTLTSLLNGIKFPEPGDEGYAKKLSDIALVFGEIAVKCAGFKNINFASIIGTGAMVTGGNGDPLSGGNTSDTQGNTGTGFMGLASAISEAVTTISGQMDSLQIALQIGNDAFDDQINKIKKEYLPAWVELQTRLAEIIGVDGGTGENKGEGNQKSAGKDGSSESDGNGGSIIDIMQIGGEEVAARLEDPWLKAFNDFATDGDSSIRSICDKIIEMVKEMADTIQEQCAAAANALNALAETASNSTVSAGGSIPGKKISVAPYAEGTVGKAFAKGTGGYKGLLHDEKNAVRSEYGQPELTVYPDGTAELTTEPTMGALPKGTVIFNEEQTERIMKNKGEVIGNAYVKGATRGEDKITYLPNGMAVFPMSMKVLPDYMTDPTYLVLKMFTERMEEKGFMFMDSEKALSEAAKNITNISSAVNNNNSTMNRNMNVDVGGIHVHGVQNPEDFSDIVSMRAHNRILQEMKKY